jgi:L-ribulose-5-phosphate 4-epimerase
MLEALKQEVCDANLQLVREGLVIQTFGNVSGIDRASGHVVIKPSGVRYDGMTAEHMVVVSLATGEVVEGTLNPSSDTPTHLVLYRAFSSVGGVVHTHSPHATAWAQAGRDIPSLGTTHADFFGGPVPCTRRMQPQEIRNRYEAQTGEVILERFQRLDPTQVPGVLVNNHGPFAWGRSVPEAVKHATALEFIARLATETLALNPRVEPMPDALLTKHFSRKHGPAAYYGQK